MKATGAWTNRDTTVDDSILGPIDTSYDQDTYGLLAGADMRPGSGDGPVRLGLFGGYVNSSGKFDAWGTTAKFEGGTVGAYLDFTNDGGMYADATVKADFLNLDYMRADRPDHRLRATPPASASGATSASACRAPARSLSRSFRAPSSTPTSAT